MYDFSDKCKSVTNTPTGPAALAMVVVACVVITTKVNKI